MTAGTSTTLIYVHDPMCSWCWAFRPVWQQIHASLPDGLVTRRLLGGLAPDTDEPMPPQMRDAVSGYWRVIQHRVPGTRFNFDFWERNTPRRATYPACRAVIAAREQGEQFEEPMILAIQQAYYLQARNPSEEPVLIDLAGESGLDQQIFARDLVSDRTRQHLLNEITEGQRMGVIGFPSLLLARDGVTRPLSYDYNDPTPVIEQLRDALGLRDCRP